MLRLAKYWYISVPVAVIVVALLLLVVGDNDRIDAAHCNDIHAGMTRADVTRILGRQVPPATPIPGADLHPLRAVTWTGKYGSVRVRFDASDRVAEAEFRPNSIESPPWKPVQDWLRKACRVVGVPV
jgi:hypothetical protein